MLNLRDQVLSLRDQVLDLCDQVLNLRDQVLDLRDQVLDLCDQVLNLRDQVLNLRDRTGPDRTGLVAATGPAREARRAIFLTRISGNVLGSIGNAKGMLSISAVAASQNAV